MPGGTSPTPSAHASRAAPVTSASSGTAGTVGAPEQRSRVVGVEPAVGRDVVHAREIGGGRERRARRRGRRRAPTCTGGAAPAHPERRAAEQHARGQPLRTRADDRRGAQGRGDRRPGARGATRRAGARPRRPAPPERTSGSGRSGTSSVSGTSGSLAHAPYTAALDTRTIRSDADRGGRVEHLARPVDVHARHQRLVGDRIDDRRRGARSTSTPSSSGVSSRARDVDEVVLGAARRRAGSRTSSPTTRVTSAWSASTWQQRLPDETGRAGDGDRRHVHRLTAWPTILNLGGG